MVAFAGSSKFRGDVGCKKAKAASCRSEATGFCDSLEGETGTGGDAGLGVSSPNTFTMIKMAAAPMIQFLVFDNDNSPIPSWIKAKLSVPVEFKALGLPQASFCIRGSGLKLVKFRSHCRITTGEALDSEILSLVVRKPQVVG